MWVIICIICIIAVYMYWVNGRSIFENRSAPTEAEKELIQKIVSFEQEKYSECAERLTHYKDRASEIGIEIRPTLKQRRAVNNHGLVEEHDFNNEFWMPKYYSSDIIISIYKDGTLLTRCESHNTTSNFVVIFWLVNARKEENVIELNDRPFDNSYSRFDIAILNLLDQVSLVVQD